MQTAVGDEKQVARRGRPPGSKNKKTTDNNNKIQEAVKSASEKVLGKTSKEKTEKKEVTLSSLKPSDTSFKPIQVYNGKVVAELLDNKTPYHFLLEDFTLACIKIGLKSNTHNTWHLLVDEKLGLLKVDWEKYKK